MQTRRTKGLKPLLIKYSAMLMGICYLLNPLQQQVFDVIHTVSHTILSTDKILSHDIDYTENLNVHESPDHFSSELSHEHELIDLVRTIFEASTEDNPAHEDDFVKVKCDKHLVSNKMVLFDNTIILQVNLFSHLNEELKNGYLIKWAEPPQKYLC